MDAASGSAAEEAEAHLREPITAAGGGGCSKHVWAVSQSRRAGEHITHSLAPFCACFLLTFAGLPLSGGHISKEGGQHLRTQLRLFIKERIDGG